MILFRKAQILWAKGSSEKARELFSRAHRELPINHAYRSLAEKALSRRTNWEKLSGAFSSLYEFSGGGAHEEAVEITPLLETTPKKYSAPLDESRARPPSDMVASAPSEPPPDVTPIDGSFEERLLQLKGNAPFSHAFFSMCSVMGESSIPNEWVDEYIAMKESEEQSSSNLLGALGSLIAKGSNSFKLNAHNRENKEEHVDDAAKLLMKIGRKKTSGFRLDYSYFLDQTWLPHVLALLRGHEVETLKRACLGVHASAIMMSRYSTNAFADLFFLPSDEELEYLGDSEDLAFCLLEYARLSLDVLKPEKERSELYPIIRRSIIKGLHMRKRLYGLRHPLVGNAYDYLAEYFLHVKELKFAELYTRVGKRAKESLAENGKMSGDIAKSYELEGGIHLRKKEFAQAQACMEKAVELSLSKRRKLARMNLLRLYYLAQREYTKSRKLKSQTIALSESLRDPIGVRRWVGSLIEEGKVVDLPQIHDVIREHLGEPTHLERLWSRFALAVAPKSSITNKQEVKRAVHTLRELLLEVDRDGSTNHLTLRRQFLAQLSSRLKILNPQDKELEVIHKEIERIGALMGSVRSPMVRKPSAWEFMREDLKGLFRFGNDS